MNRNTARKEYTAHSAEWTQEDFDNPHVGADSSNDWTAWQRDYYITDSFVGFGSIPPAIKLALLALADLD